MGDFEYRIFTLPKLQSGSEQDWSSKQLAEKYQNFRLHALTASPEAFASTSDSPRELDLHFTIQRLSNPKAVQFIAAKGEHRQIDDFSSEVFQDLLRHVEWLGFIVLLGPEESSTAGHPSAKMDPFAQMTTQSGSSLSTSASAPNTTSAEATKELCLHYHLNGMFVTPIARGRGIGKALIQKALATGLAQATQKHCSARFSIAVNEENTSAQGLYENVGFRFVGKEIYTQERRTVDGTAIVERVALHMEMICS